MGSGRARSEGRQFEISSSDMRLPPSLYSVTGHNYPSIYPRRVSYLSLSLSLYVRISLSLSLSMYVSLSLYIYIYMQSRDIFRRFAPKSPTAPPPWFSSGGIPLPWHVPFGALRALLPPCSSPPHSDAKDEVWDIVLHLHTPPPGTTSGHQAIRYVTGF